MKEREKMALRVNDKLKEKFLHHPEIKRIDRHRNVPKHVYNGRKEIRTSEQALKRKYDTYFNTTFIRYFIYFLPIHYYNS